MERAKANLGFKPPIDFWKPAVTRDTDEAEDYKYNKESYTTVSIPLNLDGHSQKDKPSYNRHVKVFTGGTAEEFCDHPHVCDELHRKLGFGLFWKNTDSTEEPPTVYYTDSNGDTVKLNGRKTREYKHKISLFSSTLGGRALHHFGTALKKYEDATHPADDQGVEAPFTRREIYECSINDLARLYFQHPGEALKVQKRYLREGALTFCGEYASPRSRIAGGRRMRASSPT